ncbi:hypothetical protein GEV33_000842 [Tenebrio molitor]|uniref:Uncharacterized protein n=1 Tax=Tenebrio molitor TaxID=7067 RepID=A0A8J6LGM7_TENMO|nr:hypothetical protein GEV33_000842 [Tenebrio molitor]
MTTFCCRNFKLLSFGAEAEEDEEALARENEKFMGKGKSTHDVLDDPKLSSKTEDVDDDDDEDEDEVDPEEQLQSIRKKLKREHKKQVPATTTSAEPLDTYESIMEEQRQEEKKKQYEEIQKEIQNVKKEYHKNKLKKKEEKAIEEKKLEENETVEEYKSEYDKYKSKKDALPKKGAGREQFTLQLLDKFKKKLQSMKDGEEDKEQNEEEQAW